MSKFDIIFDEFLENVREEFNAFKDNVDEEIEEAAGDIADENYAGFIEPEHLDRVVDFLHRARSDLPAHFITELDGLLRDMGR